jgi:hypothetical protein
VKGAFGRDSGDALKDAFMAFSVSMGSFVTPAGPFGRGHRDRATPVGERLPEPAGDRRAGV